MVDTVIRLFESNSTIFTTVGIGSLSDALSCEVVEERNGQFELTMTYPISGRHYNDISLQRIIATKSNPFSSLQAFRIYYISKTIDKIITIYARHISYDLSGYVAKPLDYIKIGDAFTNLGSYAFKKPPFTFYTNLASSGTIVGKSSSMQFFVNSDKPFNIRKILGSSSGTSFLNILGGEFEFDNFNVKLLQNRGANHGVHISYGKNLTDFNQEETSTDMYTSILPFWMSEPGEFGDVKLVMPTNPININGSGGKIERTYILDLSDELDYDFYNYELPPSLSKLTDSANEFLSKNNLKTPTVSLVVKFVDSLAIKEYDQLYKLLTIRLCDIVTVDFPELNVSSEAKCIRTVYNALNDRYEEIELGDMRQFLTDKVNDFNLSDGEVILRLSALA